MLAKPEHEVVYQEINKLLTRHKDVSPLEILAIAANIVGKLIALQDKKTLTPAQAMEIVARNIEAGNLQAIAEKMWEGM